MDRDERQLRSIATKFETREAEDGTPHITGYFAVFNSVYEIARGLSESIAPGAFSRTLGENPDVRALINHDTTLVLGRTKAGTLKLRQDEIGLWGDVAINPNDGDAMNLYERVKRGDVDQCSFGFDPVLEETESRPDGAVHWTLRDVELYEVSICTFPAYAETNIQARSAQREDLRARKLTAWKAKMKEELKNHGS